MSILTLARFILEFSLMDYATVTLRDSQLASAALYIALRMNSEPPWTPTLEYYTGNYFNHSTSTVHLKLTHILTTPPHQVTSSMKSLVSSR